MAKKKTVTTIECSVNQLVEIHDAISSMENDFGEAGSITLVAKSGTLSRAIMMTTIELNF